MNFKCFKWKWSEKLIQATMWKLKFCNSFWSPGLSKCRPPQATDSGASGITKGLFFQNVFNRTFRILYGRHYSFSIFPYAGLRIPSNVGQNTASNIKGVHLFCRHHLIETLRIPKAVAYDYCNSRQRISGKSPKFN